MKTLELAQFGVEELTNQEMINNHGGGDSTSLLNIGSITIADLVDLSGNSLFNGNYALFSGNGTSVNPATGIGVSLTTKNS
ncbi:MULTISPECIES: hypothetical protein [unclassified Spirosoma]|uniref:hypothetical protein n=1 Tax=unclassified Spirosoma TaxID=2621999 RepID=UPI000969E203|nr:MULTISPECIES: hypothetical protein [unclassified Spirosoma]MBN8822415.1 hypothetical protein [Spirosoma sp.]OJW73747.1 MAG: hypothetical protein BGO59_18205 [Spirosoma sp. 48-14]